MQQDHVVHIYHEGRAMRAAVAEWVVASLRRGGGALLAGTPAHVDAVRAELRALGVDDARCEAEGRLHVGDAGALLAQVMIHGRPDREAFRRAIGGPLARVRQASAAGPVRVWGELVDVLARDGQLDAARQLEDLWNELLAETDAQLLCSYHIDAHDPAAQARLLLDVCATHTDLVHEEGGALEAALHTALADVLGPSEALALREKLPVREELLRIMRPASAFLVTLREADPELGARVAQLARAHATWAA